MAAEKADKAKEKEAVSERQKALDTALSQIERQFGKGAVMKLGQNSTMNVEAIPTGSLSLDIALGIGGVPRGRIIEIFGPESSGKTTVALHVVAQAQKVVDELNSNLEELNRKLDEQDAAVAAVQAEIERKQAEYEAQRQQNGTVIVSESGYAWPLPGHYRLTSLFGYRIHPVSHKPHSHSGIDIAASTGTPIQAARSGQVSTSVYGTGAYWSYGNYVVIDHGDGETSLYAHMSSRAVSEGDMVTQGQTIGYVGTTGSSTGNHLHLEVRDNYTRVDPESKFPGLSLTHPW